MDAVKSGNHTFTPYLGPDEIEHRFGYHKAVIEGENATLPVHQQLRINFRLFAEILDVMVPNSREKSLFFEHLEIASMYAHKAVAGTAPLEPDPLQTSEGVE